MAAKATLQPLKPSVTPNILPKQGNHGRWLYCKTVVCVIGGGAVGFIATTAMLLYLNWVGNRSALNSCGASLNYPCLFFPASMVGLFLGLPMGMIGGVEYANRIS